MRYRALILAVIIAACKGTETVAPTLGSLRVASSMSGTDIDRDGVVIVVDDTIQVAVPSNGAYVFTGLVAGSHGVRLNGLTANCTGNGSSQHTVTIGADTASVVFSAVCTKAPLAATGLIAFARGDTDHTSDLWVMNGDGTGETKLRDSPGVSEFQPAWTPDGQHILFVTGSTIGRIDRLGGGFVHLADSAYSPSVSPDGQHIVFVKDINGLSAFDIWVMNADGTSPQPLTTDPASENHPTWSPDGTRIVFERGYLLYVMNADGTNPHRIGPADSLENLQPTWSPDGTKIVFARRGQEGIFHIYAIRPDGTGLTPLSTGLDNDGSPTWTADGAHILFSSGRGGVLAIWSMRADGTDLRRLSVGPPTPYDSDPASSH